MLHEVTATLVRCRYEVIRSRSFPIRLYRVYRVKTFGLDEGGLYEGREGVYWFLRLKNAEIAASGLASGSWTADGPIMASFKAYDNSEAFLEKSFIEPEISESVPQSARPPRDVTGMTDHLLWPEFELSELRRTDSDRESETVILAGAALSDWT